MCRRVLALYDLCHDTPSRPSTCSSSRPVNSPHNDVYFGLQRCPSSTSNGTPCPETNYHPTIYLPLVARTCSNACERELNPDYWTERQRTRRKEYNPFLDRMLCLGRDERLYHVVTGECVAGEEQFGDDPPVEREAYVGMLPQVPWDDGVRLMDGGRDRREGARVDWSPALDAPGSSSGAARPHRPRPQVMEEEGSPETGQECGASHMSRTSTWLDYRSHLRTLRGRLGDSDEARGDPSRPATSSRERTSSPSWLPRRLARSKSKKCLVSHES